jgi:hypothetical protein
LRLHHDKLDESLRQFSGIRAGLNLGHATWISILRAFLAVG